MPECEHDFVFIMGRDVFTGMHTMSYERVHWCRICGAVIKSFANGGRTKRYSVGMPKDQLSND